MPGLRPLAPFDGKVFALARLARTRETLIDDRTQVILRVKALLQAYAPTLAPMLAQAGLDGPERALLRSFLDPRRTLAAETARRRDPQPTEFYDRLMARGKPHTCAVVAVAAKLLRRLFAVCKRVVAGGGGYEIRDVDGAALDRRQAAEVVAERHPSKAAKARARREAKAKKRAERSAAGNTRQPAGSSNGLATTRPVERVPEEGRIT